MFKETHPILGTRDVRRAIEFYTRQLGFTLAFRDKADPPQSQQLREELRIDEVPRYCERHPVAV
jgi:catechol 2,3-dioxygenase-like lactoylglutathione lyase family enzyme